MVVQDYLSVKKIDLSVPIRFFDRRKYSDHQNSLNKEEISAIEEGNGKYTFLTFDLEFDYIEEN